MALVGPMGRIPEIPGSDYDPFYFVYILTGVFGAIIVIGPMLVPPGEDQDFFQMIIRVAGFFMWIVWVTIYIAQMYPVTGLFFKNTTLLWLSYAWGNGGGGAPMIIPTIPAATIVTTTSTTLTTTTTTSTTITTTTTTTINTTTTTTTTSTTSTSTTTTSTTTEPWAGDGEPFYFKIHNKSDPWNVPGAHGKQDNTNFKVVHVDPIWYYLFYTDATGSKKKCPETWITNLPGNTGPQWKPFWVEWDSDPVAQTTTVTVGRGGQTQYMARVVCDFLDIGEVDFQSTCESEVIVTKGLELQPLYTNITDYGLRWINEGPQEIEGKLRTRIEGPEMERNYGLRFRRPKEMIEQLRIYTDTLNVTGFYKYYEARDEPIQIGVFLGKHVWREFFVLLCSDYTKFKPRILIHIGEHLGDYCTILKNGKVARRIPCTLIWQRNNYLQFWIWYRNGTISIKAGYFKPDNYTAFLSWVDPKPFKVNLFAVRTVIGEEIPMTVVTTEVENWLIRY